MIIYKTTNMINNKIYIGQHNTSADDGYIGSGTVLRMSINKYGKENFYREILEDGISDRDTLNKREIYWIAKLSATNEQIGYNVTSGGAGGIVGFGENNPNYNNRWNDQQRKNLSDKRKGMVMSDYTKNKISDSMKGEKNHFFGKTHSNEQKLKWSKERKNTRIGKENTFYGKQHDVKTKKKLSCVGKLRTKYVYDITMPDGTHYTNIENLQMFMDDHNMGSQCNIKFKKNSKLTYYKKHKIEKRFKTEVER